jgi:hypothetical protein
VPIVAAFELPNLTKEKYEEITRQMTGGKSRMDSLSDWPVEGLLVHIAAEVGNGFRIVDVWESQEAFDSFGEKLGPLLQEAGVEGQPEIYPPHAFVSTEASL